MRTRIRNPKTGDWRLSDESKHTISAPDGRRFVHVQYSGLGLDMAAVDNIGGVHMYTVAGALGRMMPSPGDGAHSESSRTELDALVCMHWLAVFPAKLLVSLRQCAFRDGADKQ